MPEAWPRPWLTSAALNSEGGGEVAESPPLLVEGHLNQTRTCWKHQTTFHLSPSSSTLLFLPWGQIFYPPSPQLLLLHPLFFPLCSSLQHQKREGENVCFTHVSLLRVQRTMGN